MKIILLFCAVTLTIACSTPDQRSNTFQLITIEAESDTAVIHQKFVAAFDSIDSVMSVVRHSFVASEILSLRKDGKAECIPGYLIQISEEELVDGKRQYDDVDVPVESHSFAYFLPVGSQSPFVFKDPIDLATDEYYWIGSDYRIVDYATPANCKIIGVMMQTPSHAGNSEIAVTFYSWSPTDTSFTKLNRFQTFATHMDESSGEERMSGQISFVPSTEGVLGLKYTTYENDKENVNLYKWDGSQFVEKTSSQKWNNSYHSITFDADNDTSSIHRNIVAAFSAIDTSYRLDHHSLRAINIITLNDTGDQQACIPGYLIEISTVDPNYEGNESGWYHYAYFLPTQEKGPFIALSTLDLTNTDGSSVENRDLVDYEIGNQCHLLAVTSQRSDDLGGGSSDITLYAWSIKDHLLKDVNLFKTSYTPNAISHDSTDTGMSGDIKFVSSGDGSYYDLEYAAGDDTRGTSLYKWNGTTFVEKK